ncbi:MAG TPA: CHAT domain-containing protein [Propionibacteriaceae bacterium]|jgi:tetratricopeptide (TPR) repeat protein|nr:CHAT domain-containing protein [Propionibacteriaceae bacterium]
MALVEDTPPVQEQDLAASRRLLADGITAMDRGCLSDAVQLLHGALAGLGLHATAAAVPAVPPTAIRDPARTALAARILLSLAFLHHELGDSADALRAFDNAEALAAQGRHAEIEVLIHAQRGAMFLREGRLAESLAELDVAVAMLDFAPAVDQGKILINRGEAHGLLGQIAAAKADCARALALAEAYALPSLAFYARHNLGWFEFLSGDLPRALELMPMPHDGSSDFERGVVGTDRAKVLLSAGLLGEADRSLADACAALARTELVQFLAEAELTRAEVALLAGRTTLARDTSHAAVARLRPRDNRRATALGELIQLQADAAAGVAPEELVRTADRLTRTFTQLGLADQARLARLLAIEHLPPADASRRALPAIGRDQPLELRLQGRLVRAQREFARGRQRSGLRHARMGLCDLTEYQTQFGSLDLQTSSAVRARRLAATAIHAEMAAAHPTAVLAWVERARAVSGRVVAPQPPDDPETAELMTALRWTVSRLDREETAGQDRAALRQRRQQLEQAIRARSWTVRGTGATAAEPRIADLRWAIGDSVLVTLFNLDEVVHAVVLTRHRCWLQPLAPMTETEELGRRISADLDVLALDLVPEALRSSARSSLRRSLERLDTALIAPLGLPDGPVVLLPPGRLASLTWAELPSFRGRPLVIAPSASTWLGAHARFVSVPGPVLAISGPGLRRAEAEVERVAETWPGCVTLRAEQATAEAFLDHISGAQLVHVAAHGRHQRDNPLFSSIRLADGPVVGYDLDRVPDPPQHVVLSACDLGQATVRPGDEALGLTRAFLHSGTSTVISGVAKVSDRGAADLMADYHRRLVAGAAPAYALADALAAADEPTPFACFGAGW